MRLVVEDKSSLIGELSNGTHQELGTVFPLHLDDGNDLGPLGFLRITGNQDYIGTPSVFQLSPVERLPYTQSNILRNGGTPLGIVFVPAALNCDLRIIIKILISRSISIAYIPH